MIDFAYLIEPPFNVRDASGEITGCDVELARAALSMAGAGSPTLIETEFAHLPPGVAAGRWRMTTGLFATDERREQASFSRPIWALPDGLLVQRGNPKQLTGYRSAARARECVVAVVRDQVQHSSAVEFGVADERIAVFDTYPEAAEAVLRGRADAFSSVARAHQSFLDQPDAPAMDVIAVPAQEKEPAFGAFAFSRADTRLRDAVDVALSTYLGSSPHRAMMKRFGFDDAEVDLIAG